MKTFFVSLVLLFLVGCTLTPLTDDQRAARDERRARIDIYWGPYGHYNPYRPYGHHGYHGYGHHGQIHWGYH